MSVSVIELLYRDGVQADWRDGDLRLRVRPGALTREEIEALRENKPVVGAWILLKRLWLAGYELRLEPRSDGQGYFILPRGQCPPGTDMAGLFDLYENFHDVAVELLLDVCRRLKVAPEEYHTAARRIVRLPVAEAAEATRAGEM